MSCGAAEVIEFYSGPVDGLEIPVCEAVADGKVVIYMHVKLNAMYAARYVYRKDTSQYLHVDTVELHTINSGRIINIKDYQ